VFKADNHIQAQVGQSVIVGIAPQALIKSAGIIYGFPLLGVLLGAIAANMLSPTSSQADIYAMLGALFGLAISLVLLKVHNTGSGLNARYQPVILRVSNQKIINLTCERSQ
jgi:sigma-E factor negative regulatory protein RseC